MAPHVMLDQSLTVARMGTGIATYAKNLARAAAGAGYETDALLSAASPIDRRDPLLTEVRLFDVPRVERHPLLAPYLTGAKGALLGAFGLRARALAMSNIVLRNSNEPSPYARTFAATRLFEQARGYFRVTGRFPKIIVDEPPALFHATHPLPLQVRGAANIVTIHDLVPLRLPYMTLDDKRYFYRLIRAHLTRADHIVTVSEFSRRDIISLFNIDEDRISNSYQAVNLPAKLVARPEAMLADLLRNIFDLEWREFFLFVGALEPKKNVARLIDAYAASGSKRPLIIAGGAGWQNEAEHERIADPRFSHFRIIENTISRVDRVRRISYLPFEQLVALMQGARALLFPSVFEGFGLPVLEAMALGTPVLTSNVTSLPEVAGDAALLVDPYDTEAMANGIRTLDADEGLRADLAARGKVQAKKFSTEIYQARIKDIYDNILN